MPHPTIRKGLLATCALLLLIAVAMLAGQGYAASAAAGGEIAHVGQVPETPRSNFPTILDGEVEDVAANEHYVIAVGSFTQVEDKDGTILTQPYVVAFDIDSGDLVSSFRPQVNGEIAAVAFGPNSDEVFLGGNFDSVNGQQRDNVALLTISTGELMPLTVNTNGRVSEIVVANDERMFFGGAFSFVNGQMIDRIVEVHPTTGAINTNFSFTFTGEAGRRAEGQNIRFMGVTPNGTRLVVVHTAAEIDGLARRGSAVFDISNPANPSMTTFSANAYSEGLRFSTYAPSEGALSPDGSFFILVTTGHVIAFDVNGGPESPRLWEEDHQDSVFSTTVSNNAVYTGGHFCKIASGPDPTDLIGGGFTDKTCSGTKAPYPQEGPEDGAFRFQMAALNPANGTPLSWDPGTDVFHGVLTLEAIPRGVLAGGDGTYTGGIRTGRFAFFDFGAGAADSLAPTLSVTTPPIVDGPSVTIEGSAIDNSRLRSVKLRVANEAGEFLQADGSFAASLYQQTIRPGFIEPGDAFDWSSVATLDDGDYTISTRATDMAFHTTGWVHQELTVGIEEVVPCVAVFDGAAVSVSWTAVAGEDSYALRRDGTYLTLVAGLSYSDVGVGAGEHSYVVRARVGGVITDLDCGSITVPGDGASCVVSLDGAAVSVSWTAVAGEDSYALRRDGKYVTLVAGLSYSDVGVGAGEHSYVVRARVGGVITDLDCGSITVP